MAYIRRYLAGQQATTVVIAEGAITSDKISDKAVITRTIDDDAVISTKIRDETIQAEDIKAGAITTPKIADGAITTPKVLNNAITAPKLSIALQNSVRPFVPGVATDEVGDLVITAAKIANDAVETLKVKNLNVTTDKLALKSVTKEKIDDGAVDGAKIEAAAVDVTKLKNLSVNEGKLIDGSVTENKIGALAVSTGKIKDRSVTGVKIALVGVTNENMAPDAVTEPVLYESALARRHINSLSVREGIFQEEFGGNEISTRWVKTGEAGGLVVPAGVSGLKIQSGPLLHDTQDITFGGNKIVVPINEKPSMLFRLTGMTAPIELVRMQMGLIGTATEYIHFSITDTDPNKMNWKAVTRDGGADTTIDTGVAAIDGIQHFEIDISDPASIAFYINGALVATITTNIPATKHLEPRFRIDTGEALAKYFYLKEMIIIGEKPDWA